MPACHWTSPGTPEAPGDPPQLTQILKPAVTEWGALSGKSEHQANACEILITNEPNGERPMLGNVSAPFAALPRPPSLPTRFFCGITF